MSTPAVADDALVIAAGTAVERASLVTAAPPKALQPYPGLRPFERHEADIFFGREKQVDAMVDRLGRHHLLAVTGSSGSGNPRWYAPACSKRSKPVCWPLPARFGALRPCARAATR